MCHVSTNDHRVASPTLSNHRKRVAGDHMIDATTAYVQLHGDVAKVVHDLLRIFVTALDEIHLVKLLVHLMFGETDEREAQSLVNSDLEIGVVRTLLLVRSREYCNCKVICVAMFF
jgi:hypothetical protein